MKKGFIIVLISIMGFGMGCKKNDLLQPQENNLPQASTMSGEIGISLSPNGYLVFPTRDLWEETINNLKTIDDEGRDAWENSLGYTSLYDEFYDSEGDSLRKYSTDGGGINKNTNVKDWLFARLINEDGLVQIENTIYRFVTDSMILYTMNLQYYDNHYNDFVKSHFDSNYMNMFSGNLEINNSDGTGFFDYIEAHPCGLYLSFNKLNPFIRTSGPVVGPILTPPGGGGGGSIETRAKVESSYGNYWVYHYIKCSFHYQARAVGAFWVPKRTDVKLFWNGGQTETYCYIKIKGENTFRTPSPQPSLYSYFHHASKLKWKPYTGSKKVKKHVKESICYATFVYKDINTGQYESLTTNVLTFD